MLHLKIILKSHYPPDTFTPHQHFRGVKIFRQNIHRTTPLREVPIILQYIPPLAKCEKARPTNQIYLPLPLPKNQFYYIILHNKRG